jgi:gamma-glutamyltranspeptidase/glutathione hydrolase
LSTPDPLATQAGLAVLESGGTAIEAVVAASAMLCVLRPDRCGLGGDGVWLIAEPGRPPLSIDGTGAVCAGLDSTAEVSDRGPGAALSVAGLVSSWQLALDISARWGGRIGLDHLFAPAIDAARAGSVPAAALARSLADLATAAAIRALFPDPTRLHQPALAAVFDQLALVGLDDFYRGAVGAAAAAGLAAAGSPLIGEDLARHRGQRRRTLALPFGSATLFGVAPPTQGLAGLIACGLLDRLGGMGPNGALPLPGLLAAAAAAFTVRDTHLADPAHMRVHAATYVAEGMLDRLAEGLDPAWATLDGACDEAAVWLGAIDGAGRAVSLQMGLGRAPFGSGVTLPALGLCWQGRGTGFAPPVPGSVPLEARRRPGQTLAPALARTADGGVMVLGCTGGRAQPLLLAMIAGRALLGGMDPEAAVAAPRIAPAAGRPGVILAEPGFDADSLAGLTTAGRTVEVLPTAGLGQGGMLVAPPDGPIGVALDPRAALL